ncbi:hypothetical protein [Shewanella khirikhana]|uniref:DUF4123 domain-containing protein n=1 Tax=Shewanella khirikhana TaxID=1965282 RepID=A0ABN5TVN7_9GAMM|nr:hypothetical protein [Shewanella khirikhana]AZQ11504.1 hypothetical protein STH12_02426 [Shewanella khirikhana]
MNHTPQVATEPQDVVALHELLRRDQKRFIYALLSLIPHPDWQEAWQICQKSDCWRYLPWSPLLQTSDTPVLLLRLEEGNPAETHVLWLAAFSQGAFAPLLHETDMDWEQVIDFWQQRLVAHYPSGELAQFGCHANDVFPRLWHSLSGSSRQLWLANHGDIYLPIQDQNKGLSWSLHAQSGNDSHQEEHKFLPLRLDEPQYEYIARPARRYEQTKALFARLSLYHSSELSLERLTQTYLSFLEDVEQAFPSQSAVEHEYLAQRCFVWGRHYHSMPEFKSLLAAHSVVEALTLFQLQCEELPTLAAQTDFYQWLTP